jgi:hypothetical protein
MRLTIIIILAILAGFAAGIIKELFPALHNVPTQVIIILTAFVVGIIILLFQRARGTLHDDHWAKDQFKNKEDKEGPAAELPQSQSQDDEPPGEAEALVKIKHLCWMAGMSAESVALDKKSGTPRSRKCEYLMLVCSQATNQGSADRTARTGDQNSHRTSLFSSLCGDSRAFRCSVLS